MTKGTSGNFGRVAADHFGSDVGIVVQPPAMYGVVERGVGWGAKSRISEQDDLGVLLVTNNCAGA